MTNKKLLLMVLVTVSSVCIAQKKSLVSINQNDLRSYMSFFASDEMGGRETGTGPNDAAAVFIKTNIMRLGLKPAYGTQDFFQKIPLMSKTINWENSGLDIANSAGQVIFSTDSLVFLNQPSGDLDLTGKLVFAGYGYEDKTTGYNDLNGIDLKDKIVLIMTRNPDIAGSESDPPQFDERIEAPKIMSIITRGAKVVLLVYDPANSYKDAYSAGLADMIPSSSVSFRDKKEFSLPVQISFVTRNTANKLIESTGRNLKQMQEKIASTGKPVSVELQDILVTVRTSIEKKDFSANNVIGVIEGTDPILKNECIIYTAHFDHTGINKDGSIFNGADDNASGSMALLEVAEAFMKLKKKPLRTIVFAWVNGEEKGLLGSRYYISNPLMPLEKTLADINLDMVGRSRTSADMGNLFGFEMNVTEPGQIYLYSAHESSELLGIVNSAADEIGITVKDMGKDLEAGSSDHVPFMEKGVPALLFHSGIHADLHGPGDDVEKIDFDKMEKVSKMVFLIGYNVANRKERIVVDNPYKEGL